ncbi:MAG: hypothetical protein FJ290_21465 [Planctomycetes bacterium]|nr:hypothetical protein [Planctomycetota bacterium]
MLATCLSHDIALAPGGGEKSFFMLLPIPWQALGMRGGTRTVEVYPRFLTERGALRLPMIAPALPEANERRAVVAIVGPRDNLAEGRDKMLSSLALEMFRPTLPERSFKGLLTKTEPFAPEELPAQPLAYCAFDVMFLTARGFAALRGDQLDAILRWTRAGGSVAVAPQGVLTARQVQFLNELADRDLPMFQLDAAGRLLPTEPPREKGEVTAHLLRPCLGRAAVITAHPPKDHDYKACPQWRAALAFLWKVRVAQLPSVREDGKWRGEVEQFPNEPPVASDGGAIRYGDVELETRLAPAAFHDQMQIASALMPKDVQRISFAGIVAVLVLFILLIGPADYYLLGLIRMRKLTWLFLPIAAVAFTYAMVRLSEHYMGMRDRRRAVVIVDVDRKGQPVRQTRFELLFPGAERTLAIPLKSTILHSIDCSSLTRREDQEERYFQYGPQPMSPGRRPYGSMVYDGMGEPMLMQCEGSVLGQSTITQRVRQWSPVLYRTFSFEPPERKADVQWDAVGLPDFQEPFARSGVPAKLFRGRRSPAGVFLFPSRGQYQLQGSLSAYPVLGMSTLGRRDPALQAWCCHMESGLFAIVSQLAPAGAMHFEDLPVVDSGSATDCVLAVVEQAGDETYVYRRLYRGEL